jgi:hypothetical protein
MPSDIVGNSDLPIYKIKYTNILNSIYLISQIKLLFNDYKNQIIDRYIFKTFKKIFLVISKQERNRNLYKEYHHIKYIENNYLIIYILSQKILMEMTIKYMYMYRFSVVLCV